MADFNGKLLYNFLPINTALHKHFELTAITPILSPEIISYATHIPLFLKYDNTNGMGKIPLRRLLEKYKMHSFVTKEKLGFNVNTVALWQSHGKRLCNRYLTNSRIVQDGWIQQNWIDKYLDNIELDVKYVNKFLNDKFNTENEDYVIASDTDSIYVKFDKLVKQECEGMQVEEVVDQWVNPSWYG